MIMLPLKRIWGPHSERATCALLHRTSCSSPGPVFCLLLGVSSDCAQPITGQVTEVTCPVIGRAQPELTLSKRKKTGPGPNLHPLDTPSSHAPSGTGTVFLRQQWLHPHIDGILPTGPYPPCLCMADRALLAGYPRHEDFKAALHQ